MKMYKLRSIVSRKDGGNIKGITIPSNISMFFKDTCFNIQKSGTSIILTSGATQVITSKQIEEYTYEDCDII